MLTISSEDAAPNDTSKVSKSLRKKSTSGHVFEMLLYDAYVGG